MATVFRKSVILLMKLNINKLILEFSGFLKVRKPPGILKSHAKSPQNSFFVLEKCETYNFYIKSCNGFVFKFHHIAQNDE